MKSIVLTSIEEYIEITEKYKGKSYFRGQANSQWNIEPSIFRNSDSLKQESILINKSYGSNSKIDIIKEILRLQHYGKPTRLCDLTINPLVALFFAIDGEEQLQKDGVVFIFDKSEEITIDNLESDILLRLATKEYESITELLDEVNAKLEKKINAESLKKIMTSNFILKYSRELAHSNSRAALQGGTGILFSFDINDDNCIIRKGHLKLKSMCKKIIIPAIIKEEILKFLSNYGIKKELLYDRIDKNRRSKEIISYKMQIDIEALNNKFCSKIIVDVLVDDILFTRDGIEKILNEVMEKCKDKYGKDRLLFIYMYYDERDKRNFNWITYGESLNYNQSYHIKRMSYINEEISIFEIKEKTEPIVKLCIELWKELKENHTNYIDGVLDRKNYVKHLEQINKKLKVPVYGKLQDINHGGEKFDKYYNNSNQFCMNMISIIEELIQCFNTGNIEIIDYMYKMRTKECERSFEEYVKSLKEV